MIWSLLAHLKEYFFSWYEYKIGKNFLKFGDIKIETSFILLKKAVSIGDVNIDKIVITEELPCAKKGSKYFVG